MENVAYINKMVGKRFLANLRQKRQKERGRYNVLLKISHVAVIMHINIAHRAMGQRND